MTLEEQNARFDLWLKAYAAILHHIANGFATGADREDLLQELLVTLWRAAPRFRGGSKESTYIYQVAHNAALTWRRSRGNYQARLARVEEQAVAELEPARGNSAASSEILDHVYAAIRRLPPLDRSLILLHLDALPYAEIAAIHGMNESAVGARLARIRTRLTNYMKEIIHELR